MSKQTSSGAYCLHESASMYGRQQQKFLGAFAPEAACICWPLQHRLQTPQDNAWDRQAVLGSHSRPHPQGQMKGWWMGEGRSWLGTPSFPPLPVLLSLWCPSSCTALKHWWSCGICQNHIHFILISIVITVIQLILKTKILIWLGSRAYSYKKSKY